MTHLETLFSIIRFGWNYSLCYQLSLEHYANGIEQFPSSEDLLTNEVGANSQQYVDQNQRDQPAL